MRIVLVHRYFWPDTSPYGILLRRIAEHLASEGNQVRVYTGEPTYSKEASSAPTKYSESLAENLTIRRARLFSEQRLRSVFRVLNDLLFCFKVVLHIICNKPEVVMCSTQPPVLGAAATSWAARRVGAKFIYHLQDIYPEVIVETGHVRQSLAMRLLKRIDKRTVRLADRIVVLSNDMANAMVDRASNADGKVTVIPNFNLPRFNEVQSPTEEMTKTPGCFRLMFAGNVGRFQNLDEIVDACLQIPRDKPFEFVLLGDGKAKDDLREKARLAGDERIIFIPRQPLEIAEPLMAESDLCVVSLEPKVHRYAFPSKLASYLSLGSAVLIVCESESELSRIAVEHGFGVACEQTPAKPIQHQIRWAIDHPEQIAEMRDNASKFFNERFSLEQVLPQWTALFRPKP